MQIFTTLVICFLAVYGTFNLLYDISIKLGSKEIQKDRKYTLIKLDDTIDVEGYLRSALLEIEEDELVILNLCNNETNLKILNFFQEEYQAIRMFSKEKYLNYINTIE